MDFCTVSRRWFNEKGDGSPAVKLAEQVDLFSRAAIKILRLYGVGGQAYRCVRTVAQLGLIQSTSSGFKTRPALVGGTHTLDNMFRITSCISALGMQHRQACRYPGLSWQIPDNVWSFAHPVAALEQATRDVSIRPDM